MQAPPRAPADRMDVFDILELLELVPGVFSDVLLPQLEPRHQAALALTCTVLRDAVQQSARTLNLRAGNCCLSRAHMLGQHLPNIRSMCVRPGNLHEAMFVLPLLFMQSARDMTGLTSLQLHDQLPDRPPEEVQCGSCNAWASTYDLSAILATAAHCMPRLASLRFTTHYISDAECAAINLMTGLTGLELRSTHGTHMGGLARLTSLQSLAHLSLSDREYSMRASHKDTAMLLGCTSLTHLSLGPHTMTHPLISCLAEMHSPAWTANIPARRPSQQQQQQVAVSPARPAPAAAAASGVCESLAADCVSDRAFALEPAREVPPPPPLASLRLVLQNSAQVDRTVTNLGCLTRLTRLVLGWIPGGGQVVPAYLSPYAISQLSQLTQLCELGLGWAAEPPSLAAIADMSSLTSLQLGGLFSATREPGLVGELRLPHIRRLTAHLETHPSLLAHQHPLGPPSRDPLEQASCASALEAFPALTRLELTGRLYGPALAHLPGVLPRESLRELLLPQRLQRRHEPSLSVLRKLRALTHLRLGWRSMYHAGPASYRPATVGGGPHGSVPSLRSLAYSFTAAPERLRGFKRPKRPYQYEVVMLDESSDDEAAAAAAAAGGGCAHSSSTAAAAAAASDPTTAVAAAATPLPCDVCQTDASVGCLCRLQSLEVVGPLPPSELQWLTDLPALRTLILRDNASWSSGMTLKHLADLCLHLTALELYRCEGASAHELERMCLAEAQRISASGVEDGTGAATVAAAAAAGAGAGPQGGSDQPHPSSNICHVCRISEVPRGGVTAAELGRGHQYMGVCLTACEEWGLLPGEATGGGPRSSEVLPPEPPAPGAPPMPPPLPGMGVIHAGNGQHGLPGGMLQLMLDPLIDPALQQLQQQPQGPILAQLLPEVQQHLQQQQQPQGPGQGHQPGVLQLPPYLAQLHEVGQQLHQQLLQQLQQQQQQPQGPGQGHPPGVLQPLFPLGQLHAVHQQQQQQQQQQPQGPGQGHQPGGVQLQPLLAQAMQQHQQHLAAHHHQAYQHAAAHQLQQQAQAGPGAQGAAGGGAGPAGQDLLVEDVIIIDSDSDDPDGVV